MDWVVKGLVAALCAGAMTTFSWGIGIQTRVHDLESGAAEHSEDIEKLSETQDSYQQLRVDLAVLQSQSADNMKKLDRIETLLLRLSGGSHVP